ncbi:MAG: nickel pincer cofactor biosynthesis protein LarB [Desulfuromonadaceae bacterium]|nr:nickel pincer cofactor biosynthesis protein LarB [Desulfuromonadaceae bacterium]MDD2856443.1 nickel pincer cofactor biosynthesis protein LarB [Desulfuromonadaceae bacterium]
MNHEYLKELLNSVQGGDLTVDDAMTQLQHLPYQDIGCAQIDHHRQLRQGMPEMIYGEGKTAAQISAIAKAISERRSNVLVTRLGIEKAETLINEFPGATYHSDARCLTLEHKSPEQNGKGTILVVSAGTSDIPVASEAVVTARFLGNRVEQIYDVGVAGIHRLLARAEQLTAASVIIVVAGMEGALPSVIGGLVDKPVIAVPTSVGYGASFGGIAALLGMLNSCASGVTVVNIDNGFGAACAANLINRL